MLYRINKFFLFLFLFFIGIENNLFASMFPNAYQYSISKTYLKTRNLNGYNMPLVDAQMAMPLEEDADKNSGGGVALYAVGIIGNSLQDSNFGNYFSISQKPVMKVKGDGALEAESRDIRAEFIGGSKDTDMLMELHGKQDLSGAKVLMQFSLEHLFKISMLHGWFFSIRTSFAHLEQKLSMDLEGTPKEIIPDIRYFFSNTTENTKIDGCPHTANGLENITLTLDGIYTTKHNGLEVYYYTGVEIPTSYNNPTTYLFGPVIGNNGNIGLIAGADFHGFFYKNDIQRVGLLLEIENHFLIYKTINRTYDLFTSFYENHDSSKENRNKPWSRYLPAYSFEYPASKQRVSGVSNLPTRMHPCNNVDASLGILYNFISKFDTKWYLALGYNLWMSQPEYTELMDRNYPREYKNFYEYGILGKVPDSTSQKTTIKEQASDDPNLVDFTYLSLDYGSVASDGGYSNSIFFRGTVLSAGGASCMFGGWYEIGKSNTIPTKVGGWIGFGIEF